MTKCLNLILIFCAAVSLSSCSTFGNYMFNSFNQIQRHDVWIDGDAHPEPNNCTRYHIDTIDNLKHQLTCPAGTSFQQNGLNFCTGPPSWCKPDCFGNKYNTLMEWTEWGLWERVWSRSGCYGYDRRYRCLKNCASYPVVEGEIDTFYGGSSKFYLENPSSPENYCSTGT